MKYLTTEAYEYMDRIWGLSHSHNVDDLTMMWESDEPECVAKMLVDAGAVEPNCKEARELIRVAKALTWIGFRRKINKVLKNYEVIECTNCNYHHFIQKNSGLNLKDWINGSCDGCDQSGFTKLTGEK